MAERLQVYDLEENIARCLMEGEHMAGAAGVYFYPLEAGSSGAIF